jgi:hypothetical protein
MARSIVILAALVAAAAVAMPAAAKDKKRQHSDFQMTKKVDVATPMLRSRKRGENQTEYMRVNMNDAIVSSRQTGTSGGPHTATPLSATSPGLLQGGGGTVGGGGATRVRQAGPTAH